MNVAITDRYKLKPGSVWKAFSTDNFAFWISCCYLFFEYVRPSRFGQYLKSINTGQGLLSS